MTTDNTRLLGSTEETGPARLLDEEEVEQMVEEREEAKKKVRDSK